MAHVGKPVPLSRKRERARKALPFPAVVDVAPIAPIAPSEPSAPVSAHAAIELSAEDAQVARTQILLIQHHQQIIQSLDESLLRHIGERYHVNIALGGGWQLNVAAGLLEPLPPDEEPQDQPS